MNANVAAATALRCQRRYAPLKNCSEGLIRHFCHDEKLIFLRNLSSSSTPPPWRSTAILDDWVQREARPISLRQLTVFGRSLTESRLLSSANYVRTELPTRIAHRLRDLQTLPYAVIANPHMSHVHDLYFRAFDIFRRIPEIKSLDDNKEYCQVVRERLREHMVVIPRLVTGLLETQNTMEPEATDRLMTTLLRSRISRRVIAEQHLALTDKFNASMDRSNAQSNDSEPNNSIGQIFLRCNAREVVERCANKVQLMAEHAYGKDVQIPKVVLQGDTEAAFPYIPSHLEYIVGELLRNSVQAVAENKKRRNTNATPPIEILVCETPQHVIMRFSDQGGGMPQDVLPCLWSFVKGPRRQARLENLNRVPQLAATLEELQIPEESSRKDVGGTSHKAKPRDSSLSSLSSRPPDLRLGMGLPMSKIYAEYWAGSLELHSLEGYGVDVFLQMSKLGNKNEQLSTRATMDAL